MAVTTDHCHDVSVTHVTSDQGIGHDIVICHPHDNMTPTPPWTPKWSGWG